MVWIQAITLVTFLGLAAAWDLRERRVPNGLVAAFAAVALALAVTSDGTRGLCWAGGGFALGLGLLLVPFALGFLGAGDAKFFGVVGGFLGPRLTLYAFLFGTALGAVAAIPRLWKARRDQMGVAQSTCPRPDPDSRDPGWTAQAATLPYAVPLGLGALTAVALDVAALGLP